MKYSHEYVLLKDTPTHKAGRTIAWSGNHNKFFFRAISEWKHDNGKEGIYLDYNGPSFTVEEAKNTGWFKPTRKEVDFIPPFPSKNKIEEYVYLSFETRLVNDVDECRAMNALFNDESFQDALYEFVKMKYNEYHSL